MECNAFQNSWQTPPCLSIFLNAVKIILFMSNTQSAADRGTSIEFDKASRLLCHPVLGIHNTLENHLLQSVMQNRIAESFPRSMALSAVLGVSRLLVRATGTRCSPPNHGSPPNPPNHGISTRRRWAPLAGWSSQAT